METQAPYLTEAENQYTPWVELGIDELTYYQRLYLEVTIQNAELERDLEEAREMIDKIAGVCFALLSANYILRGCPPESL